MLSARNLLSRRFLSIALQCRSAPLFHLPITLRHLAYTYLAIIHSALFSVVLFIASLQLLPRPCLLSLLPIPFPLIWPPPPFPLPVSLLVTFLVYAHLCLGCLVKHLRSRVMLPHLLQVVMLHLRRFTPCFRLYVAVSPV